MQIESRPLNARLPSESLADLKDQSAILEHLQRIRRAIVTDPTQVIGSAKELIESTARVVLTELGLPVDGKADVPAPVKDAQIALGLRPSSHVPGPDGSDAVKKVLGSVTGVAVGVAELRNRYGTGHGAARPRVGLTDRHAHLAVNAAFTWCQLMLDTLVDQQAPWRRNTSPCPPPGAATRPTARRGDPGSRSSTGADPTDDRPHTPTGNLAPQL